MSTRISCKLNGDGSICLQDILESFNSPILEEHAWALCYQGCKFYIGTNNQENIASVTNIGSVYLLADGNFSKKTFFPLGDSTYEKIESEQHFLKNLAIFVYKALDYACSKARVIDKNFKQLITDLISLENLSDRLKEKQPIITTQDVLYRCETHLTDLTKTKIESHYKAVIRALVTEAIELSTFLEKVAQSQLVSTSPSSNLNELEFADWAKLWVQVIAELRLGVRLRKLNYSRAPIEYELTPYEILMKDIRSCRHNLRKVMINGDIPYRVTKDAHAIILEFIKSRPPLKKVSDRKLLPRVIILTPREKLMNSIRKGYKLAPVSRNVPKLTLDSPFQQQQPTRKLITVDLSQLHGDEDDDDDDDEEDYRCLDESTAALEAYDLAMHGFDISYTDRRHTLGIIEQPWGSQSVPHSRPCSRQSCNSSDTDSIAPEMSQSMQERLLDNQNGKTWHENMSLEDRLSLTLEEVVHIRSVLTKAELEALPVEGRIRSDVENRKVCFLCLKTRFAILGPWGQRCIICKRTVCFKCYTKMNIPMEHLSGVPVALLSPSILATPDEDYQSSSSRATPELDRISVSSIDQPIRIRNTVVEKFKNPQLVVCNDCKMMLQQIIKAARTNRTAIRNKTLQNLSLNLSPVF